ncbi:tetratricopeptide repeat-containing sulfotransferase family protein [Sphingomonas sp. PAMC 26621]|uniref:tetratricopeptide repeat-containing sulfotransferase family protein n=1 Tax=Sphingomonas sp. PAMC 26621 TaxID=1112213 RepID=UPI000289D489|nr:sulfotransferase [Sphingomonas sp. PAMC 26621]
MTVQEDRDALLKTAATLRAQGRIPDALALLDRLEAAHPTFSRLYQERGHCHVLLRNTPAAIHALHEAVRRNPTLPASWDMLEQLHRLAGNAEQAEAAARSLATLKQLPVAIVVANSLFADGDLAQAEQVLRAYLPQNPQNVGALRLLARIRTDRSDPAEAERILHAVLDHAPDYHDARLDYALVLLQQQKHAPARTQAERLLAQDANHRAYLKPYAAACVGLGDYAPVIDVYARLLEDKTLSAAEIADLRQWRATALKIVGRQHDAIADYHAALTACPDYGVAWFGLANLKTYRFSDAEIDRMQTALARPGLQQMDRIYLNFALGKALEDREDYAASWHAYAQGNALRHATARYRPEAAEACVQRLQHTFTPQFFAERAGWGVDDPAPIFIVGLPRSGSTLIEQILASHPGVEGTQELTEIGRYAAELCGSDPTCGLPLHPEALHRLTATATRALGDRFLTETRPYRTLDRPLFIDKMPNNVWHIGLIHLILPRATIIDVRRDPMACCFSNLKQLFGTTNQEFSYATDDIARHYRCYLELMRHWDEVLPGRVLRVQQEDVVTDLDASARRLLAHCGLPFDPACLSFHETRRSVRTPSSEQVRQPIDRTSLTQWRHYEPWLAPLRTALGDALTTYRS